jgi:glc operon protein GlcG
MKNLARARLAVFVSLFAVVLTVASADVWAQGSTAAPFSKVTVSEEVAKRTLMKAVINADTARAIVDACVNWQKSRNGAVSIFVITPTGEIVDSHQMDGVAPIGTETALMKAKTALYARSSSADVMRRFNTTESRLFRIDLGKAEGLSFYFAAGGLPIVVDNQMIGAVGVGGGPDEEMCAYQALQKVLGPQPPLSTQQPAGGAQAAGRAGPR